MPKETGPRRRYEDDFKRKVVLEAVAPDTSVAEVARRHGLNANLVFNWRKKFGSGSTPAEPKPAAYSTTVPENEKGPRKRPKNIWPEKDIVCACKQPCSSL